MSGESVLSLLGAEAAAWFWSGDQGRQCPDGWVSRIYVLPCVKQRQQRSLSEAQRPKWSLYGRWSASVASGQGWSGRHNNTFQVWPFVKCQISQVLLYSPITVVYNFAAQSSSRSWANFSHKARVPSGNHHTIKRWFPSHCFFFNVWFYQYF